MDHLPAAIARVLESFAPVFRRPTWKRARQLLVGAWRTAIPPIKPTWVSDDDIVLIPSSFLRRWEDLLSFAA